MGAGVGGGCAPSRAKHGKLKHKFNVPIKAPK